MALFGHYLSDISLNQIKGFILILCCNVCFRYAVYDLKSDRKYLVDLSVALCFNASGPCVLDTVILQHVVLPKRICKLYAGYTKNSQ